MMQELLAFLKTFNLIVLIITFPLAVFLIYKRKLIQKRLFIIKHKFRGQFYCEMHLLIKNAKNSKDDYNPSVIIGKFLREFYISEEKDITNALDFWSTLYIKYSNELIADLEKERISLKDMTKYEKLFYPMHHFANENHSSQITNENPSNISKEDQRIIELRKKVINQALIFASPPNKKQAIRLGNFYNSYLIDDAIICKKSDNREWEKLLKLPSNFFTEDILIENPYYTATKNFTVTSVKKSLIELKKWFSLIGFHEAENVIEFELNQPPFISDEVNFDR
jgi:hypothetical protein